jgi:hypothetical protein
VASGSILYITIPMRISNKIGITHPTNRSTLLSNLTLLVISHLSQITITYLTSSSN